MPFNGAGLFTRLFNWQQDRDNGIKILADRMDQEMDGFAQGLSNTIARDGQSTVSANIPFNNRKITGLGNATESGDALNRATGDARYVKQDDAGTAAFVDTGTDEGNIPVLGEDGKLPESTLPDIASDAADISYDDSVTDFGLDPADLNVQKAIEAVASRGGKEIGEVFFVWDHLSGVEPPDNDEGEYIRLTAGQSGSGGYNEGLLTNESVSGSAPLVEATAEIATGPLQGETIHLINTEEAFLRARETSGELQMDQMQRITGEFESQGPSGSLNLGAFEGSATTTNNVSTGGGGSTNRFQDYTFNSANSPDARASSTASGETRSKNVSGTAYMRIA